MRDIQRGRPLSVVFCCLPADDQSYEIHRIAGNIVCRPSVGVSMVDKRQCHATDLHCSGGGGGGGGGGLRTSASAERRPAHYSTVRASDL